MTKTSDASSRMSMQRDKAACMLGDASAGCLVSSPSLCSLRWGSGGGVDRTVDRASRWLQNGHAQVRLGNVRRQDVNFDRNMDELARKAGGCKAPQQICVVRLCCAVQRSARGAGGVGGSCAACTTTTRASARGRCAGVERMAAKEISLRSARAASSASLPLRTHPARSY